MHMRDNSHRVKLNALLFHRILPRGEQCEFEDFPLDSFQRLLSIVKDKCIDPASSFRVTLPDDPILLTFDDGLITDYSYVLPNLLDASCKALFFVVPELVGTRGYCSWDILREMSAQGMTIGSHSMTHPDLLTQPIKMQREEMRISKTRIEQELGVKVVDFSFPFGRCNNDLIELAFYFGYERVFTSYHGVSDSNASAFRRNSINGQMSLAKALENVSPNLIVKGRWYLEDLIKHSLVNFIGRKRYLGLRASLYE